MHHSHLSLVWGLTQRLPNQHPPVIYFQFYDFFILRHNMVKYQIFIALFSATMNHGYFKLCMVLLLGVLHVAKWIYVTQLSTAWFMTSLLYPHKQNLGGILESIYPSTRA